VGFEPARAMASTTISIHYTTRTIYKRFYLVAYEKDYIFFKLLEAVDPPGVLNIRKFHHFRNKVDHDESFELSFNIGFVLTTENVPLSETPSFKIVQVYKKLEF
jgi:hypothetical protein